VCTGPDFYGGKKIGEPSEHRRITGARGYSRYARDAMAAVLDNFKTKFVCGFFSFENATTY